MLPINITCPCCQYHFDLLSGLEREEHREYLRTLTNSKFSAHQLGLLLRYLTLFKPKKNAQSFAALKTRTSEIIELINSGRVHYKGGVHVATRDHWFACMDNLATERRASLELPFTSHQYLISMVYGNAEKAASIKEAKDIDAKRNGVREEPDTALPQRDEATAEQGLRSMREVMEGMSNLKPPTPGDPNA